MTTNSKEQYLRKKGKRRLIEKCLRSDEGFFPKTLEMAAHEWSLMQENLLELKKGTGTKATCLHATNEGNVLITLVRNS